jgi:hypothetical protein
MTKRNPFDDPQWLDFVDRAQRELIPKLAGSAVVLVIAPDIGGKLDIQFALQIGASILMEKPLLVVMPKGREPPPKLMRVADRIIFLDPNEGPAIEREIKQFFRDFGRQ